MSRTRVKICGITRPEDALAAVSAGADAVGLVFYEPSARFVSLDMAAEIVSKLPAFITVTGLFVDPDVAEVEAACEHLRLDLLQFHGGETEQFCNQFRRPYMKALRVSNGEGLEDECAAFASASAILLDTWHENLAGGTGEVFNWDLVPSSRDLPIVLAGGLNADNVAAAVRQVRPYAVDVSGGVEDAPGIKSASKIDSFIEAVSNADAARKESK